MSNVEYRGESDMSFCVSLCVSNNARVFEIQTPLQTPNCQRPVACGGRFWPWGFGREGLRSRPPVQRQAGLKPTR